MPLNPTPIPAFLKNRLKPLWLLLLLACSAHAAHDKWIEYNIGPFFVDTDSDPAAARQALTQMEQLRWVLSGLLEIRELNTIWPVRVLITNSAKTNPNFRGYFVSQNGQYLLVAPPNSVLPLGQLAGFFLEANTPRLPVEEESGFLQLFDTLQANGSRVTWGGAPAHADLGFSRLQLFATKFEYSASFHIFLTSLRNGSTVHVAEKNAFGKNPEDLEKEAAANLEARNWHPVAVNGRPLDPKRDFGEHSLDNTLADIYIADTLLTSDPAAAEATFRAAISETGTARALGFEGLAALDLLKKQDAGKDLDAAIAAGSKSALIYVEAAQDLPPDQALPLLKKASALNPLWAVPLFEQAKLAHTPAEKEALLLQAVKLNRRSSEYYAELAKTQALDGHAQLAQSSWIHAEDAAADEAERDRMHELREAAEASRLDALDADRLHEREAAHLADQRAQQSEADRIHAAEDRANKASAAESGTASSNAETVDFASLAKPKKISGTIVMVDCMKDYERVAVKDMRGKVIQLYWKDPDRAKIPCSAHPKPTQVTVTYLPHDNDARGADGDVVNIAWR
jgi:hypothetical protein